ncbi:hypothetical protein O181_110235 [Austropuccinia psidii MF-1]|uniref:Uncharacterized protein n=1 Tax=Austropuccinia psidii MF-1 TaxID=1389203 RepID=A0A9Q3JZZ6_9BASI|nr:hypothetical protein [Austropuccinia psidii MF-1]
MNTRSQRNPAFLTPTARVPLDCTPLVHQLNANLDKGPPMEGAAPSRRDEEGVESVEEEDSGETEVANALANVPEVPQGFNQDPTNQPLVSQSDTTLLKIMEQITTIMGRLSQAASPRDNSKAPVLKTPLMKEPYPFDGDQAQKLRGFIQSSQLVFHNDPTNFFSDRKKVLY